jgi:hypothetical protein
MSAFPKKRRDKFDCCQEVALLVESVAICNVDSPTTPTEEHRLFASSAMGG